MVDRSSLGEARKRPIICFLILLLLVLASTPVFLSAGSTSVAQSTRLSHESSAARPSTSASAPVVAGEAGDGSGAAVWTDKQDYSPEQTVTIYGAGFTPGATVTVTVVRPDGSINPPPWIVTADLSGRFTPPTTYQLDGITGTYTVTASDGTNTATTTFTDAVSFNVALVTPSLGTSQTTWYTVASQTTTYTLTITSTSNSIGSVTVTFGTAGQRASWGIPTVTSLSPPSGKSWASSIADQSAGTLKVHASSSTDVFTSGTMTIMFSIQAPSTSGMYQVGVTTYASTNWTGSSSSSTTLTNPSGVAVYDPANPNVTTQLVFILDGSGSITSAKWLIAMEGLAAAIRNPTIVPEDGSVELTIIEYSQFAKVEVMPVVITSSNANAVANTVCNNENNGCSSGELEYLNSWTATPSGIYLGADILKASPNYAAWKAQAINLVTDGIPNCLITSNADPYHGMSCSDSEETAAKGQSVTARNYAINPSLAMTSDKDQFDAEFVGTDATNEEWLRSSIVWPTQTTGGGYIVTCDTCFTKGPGWVRAIPDWSTFASTVKQKFQTVLKLGLTVAKQVNGGSKLPGDFTLYVKDSSGKDVAGSPFTGSPGGTTFSNLPTPATYTVSEDQISGYSLVISGDCDPVTGQVTLSGSNKQCTLTNNYNGPWLKIVKNSGSDDGTFGFTVTGPSSSTTKSIDTHGAGNAHTGDTGFFAIDMGTYSVAETVPTGWSFVSAGCVDQSNNAVGTPSGTGVSGISVPLVSTSITCTFTDTMTGAIVVKKLTAPSGDAATSFTFTASGMTPASFSLLNLESETFSGLATGSSTSYVAAETVPINWDLTDLSCSITVTGTGTSTWTTNKDAGTFTVTALGAGDTVTCTFTDTERPSIVIDKVAVGGDAQFSFTATGTGLTSPFSITTSGGSGSSTFGNLVPGTYSVTESGPNAPWSFTSLVCDSTTISGQEAAITLAAGQKVTCTFTNTWTSKATPTISTGVSSDGSIAIGGSATDTATLAGGNNPTGTVDFAAYSDDTCQASVFTSNGRPLTAGSATSESFKPTALGSYYWKAVYSGDSNNHGVSSSCGDLDETLTVGEASPSIVTSLEYSTLTLGGSPSSTTDTATLAGGYNIPTGTITFNVYGPSDTAVCTSGNLVSTSTVTVNAGNGAYTSNPAFTPNAAGTYYWTASYSGDGNNNLVSTVCGVTGEGESETLTVSKAGPSITTSLEYSTLTLGGSPSSTTDTATLAGGNNPTGTVDFTAYSDSSCSSASLVFTSNGRPVTAGSATSEPFLPSGVGLYYWQAFYGGDGNNVAVTSECSAEVLEVGASLGTISTGLSANSISIGDKVHDSATLSGVTSDAGGDVTYAVYDGGSCSGTALDTSKVTVTAGVVLDSKDFDVFDSAGTYSFQAVYSGDANNKGATSVCGTELLTVGASTTTTSETTSSTTSSTSTTTTDTTESTFSLPTTSTSQTTPDAPVGGQVYSVSKADLLEPYFALTAFLVVLAVVLGKKRRS